MLEAFQEFFRELAQTNPKWNFIYLYDPVQTERVLTGLWMTIKLSVVCVALSVVIGVVGAWLQGSPIRWLRMLVQGYIQFFRNTPPLVQLLFFYFALGQFTPTYAPDGWVEVPVISNVGWAILSLSFFAGAFNVEIFRSGIEAVPDSTKEAADALGYGVERTRTVAVTVSGALAGLGGAMLVCGPLGLFIENVTAGRGWVALAIVVFAGWRPAPVAVGAFLFGLSDAVQLRLQGTDTAIPYEVFIALPYVVTLIALVVRARASHTPAALGVPFARGAT